jgi:dinuclear metal center YbgI/SA1388 family protein
MAKKASLRRSASVSVRAIIELLETWFPPSLAEEWDNVGLLSGATDWSVGRIGVALNATPEAVRETAGRGPALLISHHPLLFKPIGRVNYQDEVGRTLTEAIKRDVALVACHTNADWAVDGVNDVLARRLGLKDTAPLETMFPDRFKKLVVFVPGSHLDAVSEAIFAAGGGIVGNYAKCSFRHPGEGTYVPLAGADPFAGKVGALSTEPELRLEVRVPVGRVSPVLAAMNAAHPYEEVAFDLLATDRQAPSGGLARVGALPRPKSLAAFAKASAKALGVKSGRFVGDGKATIRHAVVCGGGGAFLLDRLAERRDTALVTSDVKYHEALKSQEIGVPIIDLGHYGTERPFAEALAQRLAAHYSDLQVFSCRPEGDPFQTI